MWFKRAIQRRETKLILQTVRGLEDEIKSLKTMVAVLLAETVVKHPRPRPVETRPPRQFDLAGRQ